MWATCYDYQLRRARQKLGDRVLPFNLCCRRAQLAPFRVAIWRPLTSWQQSTQIAGGDTVTIENGKSCLWQHQFWIQNFVTKAPLCLTTQLTIEVRFCTPSHHCGACNKPFYSCDLELTYHYCVLMLTSWHLHEETKEVCIKARSPQALLAFMAR